MNCVVLHSLALQSIFSALNQTILSTIANDQAELTSVIQYMPERTQDLMFAKRKTLLHMVCHKTHKIDLYNLFKPVEMYEV